MKKLFLISILISSLFSNALEDALSNTAKKENKLIIIEATSDYCYYCKRMNKDVFSDQDVSDILNANFVFHQTYIDMMDLPFNLKDHFAGMTPTFFIVNDKGEYIKQIAGAWGKEDFISLLKANINIEKEEEW